MHRMNANRVTTGGTSTLDDSSLKRIGDKVSEASKKRIAKHKPNNTSIKKTASKRKSYSDIDQSSTSRMVVASLHDVPDDFERIGTGFYRQGHHLWEIMPGDGGFVLVRKRGEDHVLGDSPEPIEKNAALTTTDRNGIELKKGSRIKLPYKGKAASGTVVVLSPNALGVDLDEGGHIDVPPDMVEWAEEEASEPEHSDTGDAIKEFVQEELQEEEHSSSDKESGDVFNPDINEETKSDHVGPQSSQSGGIGGVAADHNDPEGGRNVMAQVEPTEETTTYQDPAFENFKTTEPVQEGPMTDRSTVQMGSEQVQQMRQESKLFNNLASSGGRIFLNSADGQYVVEMLGPDEFSISGTKTDVVPLDQVDFQGLKQFEENVGDYKLISVQANIKTSELLKIANFLSHEDDFKTWREYWRVVGQRVAQVDPPKPPKPKLTEEEKKQRAKERRKERKRERAGLPKGFKPPKPPKTSAKNVDEVSNLKEYNKLMEQTLDAIVYALDTVSDPTDDVVVSDVVTEELARYEEEKAKLEEETQEDFDKELSLDEPSEAEEDGIDLSRVSRTQKVVVSMSDL